MNTKKKYKDSIIGREERKVREGCFLAGKNKVRGYLLVVDRSSDI